MGAADGIRCMLMRGGTSKGAFFLEQDLPSDPAQRDDIILRVVGSPDPRQVDGVGGAHPLTTKVAVVSGSDLPGIDLEYLFLQPGVSEPTVTERQNCGNMLAAVGPFGVERGLLAPSDGTVTTRIFMKNTDSVAVATFGVADGAPVYSGDTEISGVPGSAARVDLEFLDIAGASAGALLPTGEVSDTVAGVPVTLIDNGMPVVLIEAGAIGLAGYESCEELEANGSLVAKLEEIRLAAGPIMSLGDVSTATIPKLTIVSAPRAGGTIATRTFIPHRCHRAIGVLGAVSVATAALIPGSVAEPLAEQSVVSPIVRLEHPTGSFDVRVSLSFESGTVTVDSAGIIRTARKLMDGFVYPRPA